MRELGLVGIVFLVLAFSLPASASCFHKLYGNAESNKSTLTIPTTIIVKKVQKALGVPTVAPEIEVTFEFNAAMRFHLDCYCTPCCRAPQKQVASLTVSASIRAFGGTVMFADAAANERDGVTDPEPEKMCLLPLTLAYETGDQVPAVGVGLSIEGFAFKRESVAMRFSAIPQCGCTDDPRCFGNTAPRIVEVTPSFLDLNKGGSATITVIAMDEQRNLASFKVVDGTEVDGLKYLPAKLDGAWYSDERAMGRAVYSVAFPEDDEKLRGLVGVGVVDACGLGDGRNVLVRLFYPPILSPISEGSGWRGRGYLQMFVVDDPDFRGCNFDRWEAITITANGTCGEVYPPESIVSCLCVSEECRMGATTFIPERNCCDRSFTIVATDSSQAGRQMGTLSVTVPNRPPSLRQAGAVFTSRPGKTLNVRLGVEDPDGDSVTLEQFAGPGMLRENTWSWTVPDPHWGSPWQLVGLELRDRCGGMARQFFLVRVLQPPQVYPGHVSVARGSTAMASLYIYDPDSPPGGLGLSFRPPWGVRVRVIGIEEPPPYYGSYHGYVARVEVSADQNLCPGTYAIPFTVTDPDGNSGHATLTVRVFGNRPPQVKGELSGEATVTLHPNRVQVSPRAVRGEVFDPDGDKVFVEAPGIPPQFAASLSTFFALSRKRGRVPGGAGKERD